MKKLKFIGLALIAIITFAYLGIVASHSKGYSWYNNYGYFFDTGNKVRIDPADVVGVNNSYYRTIAKFSDNTSSTHTVHWVWYQFFCPFKSDLGGHGQCDENSPHHVEHVYQGDISITTANDRNHPIEVSTQHNAPGDYYPQYAGQSCGYYQNDFIVNKVDNNSSWRYGVPDASGIIDSNHNNWVTWFWGGYYTNKDCSTVVPSPSPTYGPTVTPTYGPTVTPTTPPPHLIVKKHVINDNGGTKSAHDFTIFVKDVNTGRILSQSFGSETGTVITLSPTILYTVYEGTHDGYTQTFSGDCSGMVANGQTKTCTLVNNDIPGVTPTVTPTTPHLIVFKHVVSDGSKQASDFTMHVTGTNVSATSFQGEENGTEVSLDAGSYAVTEDQLNGFTLTGRSSDCSGYIAAGQTKACYLVNSQNGITPTPTSTNTNNCNNTNQSGNNGGNNNNNCNQQEQHQEQNQYNNNYQSVNISYAAPQQQQQQVLGVSYPVYANSLPSTGPAETWELLGALAPLGFILRKITQK